MVNYVTIGIKTPDYFWKVLWSGNDVIAYYIPNTNRLKSISHFIVSVKYIEERLNDGLGNIKVPDHLKDRIASKTWTCRHGRFRPEYVVDKASLFGDEGYASSRTSSMDVDSSDDDEMNTD